MKKIGILALALVLALGSLGVGYALWFETLFIEGTVNTGSLDAEWSVGTPYDDETKEYSGATAEIVGNTLFVTVTNAYPCITYTIPIDITNNGTIPFHICPIYCNGVSTFPGTILITDLSSNQVHPNSSVWGSITIHMDNTADMLATYTFSCWLDVVQYNEPCPTPS